MKLVKIILMSLVLLLNHIFATAETTVASSSAHDNNPNADKTLEQIMKRKDIDKTYQSYLQFTRGYKPKGCIDKATRDRLVEAYNSMALIDMAFRHNYPQALRNLISASEYSGSDMSAALLNSLGHINYIYSRCLPSRDNMTRSLNYYHIAFHKAVAEKDWSTASLAFSNSANFGFEPWMTEYNRSLVDSFKYIPANTNMHEYKEAQITQRMMTAADRHDWHGANRHGWELSRYMASLKMPDDVLAHSYLLLTRIDEAGGNNDSLGVHSSMLLDKAQRANLISESLYAYQMLAEYHRERGDSLMADRYRSLYFETRDSLLMQCQLSGIHDEYLMYRLNNADAEMAEVRYRLLMRNLALVATLIVVSVVIFLLLRLRRKNRMLRAKNERLYDNYLALTEHNSNLEAESQQTPATGAVRKETSITESRPKYGSSTLDDIDKAELLKRVRKALDDSDVISNPDCTVATIAEICADSARNVSQVINESYGNTFTAVLTEARIREVARRISDSAVYDNFTIEAIGLDIGFRSRGGFVRAFKRHTGMTPSEYLALAKERRSGTESRG